MKSRDNWLAYSWEPSTKVPGGRKHRVEEVVEAANRVEAKTVFLEKHPEEMPYQVAASRTKNDEMPSDSKSSLPSVEGIRIDEVMGKNTEPTAHTHKGPGLKQNFSDELKTHPMFERVREIVEIAKDKNQSTFARDNALAWLLGVAKVNQDSSISQFINISMEEIRSSSAAKTGTYSTP